MVTNLAQPLILNIFETGALSDIKDEEDTITALVKIPRDRTERLLACSIPDLKLDVCLFTHDHSKVSEFNTNRDSMLLFECLACQSFKNASFSDSSVAQDHNLEENIEMVHHTCEIRFVLDGHSCGQIVDLRI